MEYDLLLKGGVVIDPSQGIHSHKDVAFKDGRVIEIEDALETNRAAVIVECTGQMIAPGLVDLHIHGFWGCSHYGLEPDPHLISKGVTTALDAGSSGADTFPGFRKYVIETSDTRLFAFLHISSQGMLTREIGELKYADYANVDNGLDDVRDLLQGVGEDPD